MPDWLETHYCRAQWLKWKCKLGAQDKAPMALRDAIGTEGKDWEETSPSSSD